jgi:single-stranded-DNA-specific exonuclease
MNGIIIRMFSLNWIKESLYNSYYRYLKFIVNDKLDNFDFEGVNFIKKDINFLKDFVCFNRGYVLVSSYDSLREIEFLLNYVEINGTTNLGTDSQVIICPDIECIDFANNEVLIYDFLPGEYEYKKLIENVKSNVYNFYDDKLFNKIDKFSQDISLDQNSLFKLINDCMYNEIIGTVNEIGLRYRINPYKAYKSVLFLKDNGFIDIFVNKETLKIKAKDGLNADGITINLQDKSRDKINNLKLKLKSFIREE